MYKFRDLNETGVETKLSINTIIDGINLDDTFKFFTTLNVSGRSNIVREIEVADLKQSNNNEDYLKIKNKFLSSSIEGRTIEIQFKLKNCNLKDNKEFRKNAEKLIYYLNKEQAEIKFTDDIEYSFFGTCREISLPKEDRNSLVCTAFYEITDPFKYTDIKEKELSEGTIFNLEGIEYYQPLITDIDLIVNTNADKLVMTNISTGRRLQLNGNYIKGQKINIGEIEITSQGRNITDNLDLNADWEDFYIHLNDKFSFKNCKAIIKYRGRML